MAGTETTVEVLEQRLDRLERENRRWKWGGGVLLLGIAAAVLMGQARPASKVVEAESFILRDPSGKIRAMLAVTADGTVSLALSDSDGKPRAALGVLADGTPGLGFFDVDGKQRATLAVRADGAPGLRLSDSDGKVRAALIAAADGTPGLALSGRDEGVIWSAP